MPLVTRCIVLIAFLWPHASGSDVLALIGQQGARDALHRLYSDDNAWKAFLRHVAAGEKSALAAAGQIGAVSDAGATSELESAAGEALKWNPAGVLALMPPFAISVVCGGPDIDDPRFDSVERAIHELEARRQSVLNMRRQGLEKTREKCLNALEDAGPHVKAFYGKSEQARHERVRAVSPWSVRGADLVCTVSQRPPQTADSLPTRTLVVYSETGSSLHPLFSFETPEVPLGISPLGEYNAPLLVAWAGGSTYHFQVLAYVDGHVREVLTKGSRAYPEIIRDTEGNALLLFTELQLEQGKWRREHGTTEVFGWTGHGYDRLGQVPWAKRLECTSREACASIR